MQKTKVQPAGADARSVWNEVAGNRAKALECIRIKRFVDVHEEEKALDEISGMAYENIAGRTYLAANSNRAWGARTDWKRVSELQEIFYARNVFDPWCAKALLEGRMVESAWAQRLLAHNIAYSMRNIAEGSYQNIVSLRQFEELAGYVHPQVKEEIIRLAREIGKDGKNAAGNP